MTVPMAEPLAVSRGPYRLYAEMVPGPGVPVVLMHGFPDNTHLYDRLVPHLPGRRPVVRFDFLGWGRSDKPPGYPYTASNQAGDLAAVVGALDEHVGAGELVLVAHDASGLPAIDWALANPGRVATLVLLNTYYHWTAGLRRPPRIALYSTPIIRAAGTSSFRSCMSSPGPPARRFGVSTTTCSPRCSPAGGASAICAASAGPSG
jgi:haloalkane dehalogenase